MDERVLLSDLNDEMVVARAKQNYAETDAYQAMLRARYDLMHWYAYPPDRDSWPEDAIRRPGKIHICVNIIKPTIDIAARTESIIPRLALVSPKPDDDETNARAGAVEKVMLRSLQLSGGYGWEVWLNDLCKTKAVYGKGILKPYWNKAGKRPDVYLVENPSNLRIGWGASDYTVKDWALYEYALSPWEVRRRFPELEIVEAGRGNRPSIIRRANAEADDPLALSEVERIPIFAESDYEQDRLVVWDYWYRDEKDTVRNAIIVEGVLAQAISTHSELIDIPYIIVENDHEPGSPEGVPTGWDQIDIQIELNRALSHWAQLIADEIDPSWQLVGENAGAIPEGLVPESGEVVAPGPGNEIKQIPKTVNQFPVQQLVADLWDEYHKTSGLTEIMYGKSPGAQTTGRALSVQLDSGANRIDPRRRRLYAGLKELLAYWGHMLKVKGPAVGDKPMSELLDEMDNWQIVAPEITPRDVIENTQNVANKVQAKLISLRSGMDELGVDSPEDELSLIMAERSNATLFPGDVQTKMAIVAAMQALQQQQAMAGAATDLTGQNVSAAAAQEGAPTLMEDQNIPQPMSQPGSPPAPGGPAPAGAPMGTSLIRSQPGGQAVALNQIATKYPLG